MSDWAEAEEVAVPAAEDLVDMVLEKLQKFLLSGALVKSQEASTEVHRHINFGRSDGFNDLFFGFPDGMGVNPYCDHNPRLVL